MRIRPLNLYLAAAGVLAASHAYAQTTGHGPVALEEIVVTAQKKAESLQTVPLAVATVSADTLLKGGISDPTSLTQAVPGLRMDRTGILTTPVIRGVGQGGVASYEDEIYSGVFSSQNSFNTLAIERVEVLKGPQATLFGKDTTGGVISIVTKNPTHEPRADAEVGYGNYRTVSGQMYATTGLSNTLAANLAISAKKQSRGWGTNITTGNPTNKEWGFGARAKLLWEPTDNTSVLLSGSVSAESHAQGTAGRLLPGTYGRGLYTSPPSLGFYDETGDVDVHMAFRGQRFGAEIQHNLGWANFVSITGGTKIHIPNSQDFDAVPLVFLDVYPERFARTVTQEFRLVSQDSDKLTWLLGAYYLKARDRQFFQFYGPPFGVFGGLSVQDNTTHNESISGFGQGSVTILPGLKLTLGARYTHDKTWLIGANSFPRAATPVFNGPYRSATYNYHPFTYRVALDYHVTPDVMVYASLNRGYRGGGAGPGVGAGSTSIPAGNVTKPEFLRAYAAGFKSEFLDGRLRLNAEAYYNDFKDLIISIVDFNASGTPFTTSTNSGRAHYQGADVDLAFAASENLRLNASLNIIDAKFDLYANGITIRPLAPNPQTFNPAALYSSCTLPAAASAGSPPLVQGYCNLKGNIPPGAPKWTLNLSGQYSMPTAFGRLELVANYTHTAPYFFDGDNNPFTRQQATDIFNGSVTVNFADDNYYVRVWGKNITAAKYYSYMSESTTSGYRGAPAPPRTFGVTVGGHF